MSGSEGERRRREGRGTGCKDGEVVGRDGRNGMSGREEERKAKAKDIRGKD